MLDITILAAWGEFIGGIAVVVSLIYLASQIRQNSRLLQASTTSASSQVEVAVNTLMAQDPKVAKAYAEGLADLDSLSEESRRRFDAVAMLWIQVVTQQHQFQLDGIGSPMNGPIAMRGCAGCFSSGLALVGRRWQHPARISRTS
jgi:hypothetical protein